NWRRRCWLYYCFAQYPAILQIRMKGATKPWIKSLPRYVKYIDIDPWGGSNGLEKDPVSNMWNACVGIAVIHGTAAGWDAPAAKYIFYQCFTPFRIVRKGQKIRRGRASTGPTPVPKGDSIQLDLENGATMLVYWNGKTYRGFGQRIGDQA